MKKRFLLLIFIILASSSPLVCSEMPEEAFTAIEESYIAILNAEKIGGNVTVLIIMLNQASELAVKGGEDDIREAITMANEVKDLALSIESSSRIRQIRSYSILVVFLTISILAMIFIKKYGDGVYFSLWASMKRNWRIKKYDS
jgi:hypothetical protein